MDRKEFLSLLGMAAGGTLLATCVGGCKKSTTDAPTVNFTLDLTAPANAALLTNGGFVYNSGVIVARTTTGSFIAVSQSCTHEGQTIEFQSGNNRFYCPRHGATFSTAGAVTNGPASTNLKQYNVSVSGNVVTVSG